MEEDFVDNEPEPTYSPTHIGKIIIIPEHRKRTADKLTKAEATRLISVRAAHLHSTPTTFIDITNKPYLSTIDIAHDELLARRMPLKIRRCVKRTPDHSILYVEEWDPNDMIIPPL